MGMLLLHKTPHLPYPKTKKFKDQKMRHFQFFTRTGVGGR